MPYGTGVGAGRNLGAVVREQERDRVEAEQAVEIIEDYVVDEDDYLDIIVSCDDPESDLARFRGLVLDDYLGEQNEYIVIGAKMRCQHMIEDINLPITVNDKNGVVFKEKKIEFDKPVDTEQPRIFKPTHSTETTATGNKVFGTVHDAEHGVNIFGFGQCSFAEDKLTIEQLAYIRDNQELVRIYGTCYVLMELEKLWENPPCVARVGARINDQEWPGAQCDCRQPFKWENGTQEGLTRLSTLYCKSMKGFITFDDSGQTSESGGNIPCDVLSLMNAPIDSTWGISDSAVEAWFLSKNTAVIKKYGLNSTNIGEVTAAIKAAGVSPVFFYAYTVNENGGLGGFINHYKIDHYAKNGGDTAVNAANGDAQYLADQSKLMNSEPAWKDGDYDFVPKDVKESGNASFASMPSGSIGRAYIPATAATTWEVYYPDGLSKSYNQVQDYAAPMKDVVSFIEEMSQY